MKDKALKYIERLCLVWEDSDKTNLKNAGIIIGEIYKLAHCVQESHECYEVHKDWRKELEEMNWEM